MMHRLHHDDGLAVDLLLDQLQANPSQHGRNALSASHLNQRVKRAEQLLNLLTNMQAPDVPPDLVARTLDRIARSPVTYRPTIHPATGAEARMS